MTTEHRHGSEDFFSDALKTNMVHMGIVKNGVPYSWRHGFATHMLEDGADIRTVRELLDHKDVATTMLGQLAFLTTNSVMAFFRVLRVFRGYPVLSAPTVPPVSALVPWLWG